MPHALALLLYESWNLLDEATEGLTVEEATTRHDGGSSIAWTIGHVTTMVDSWINVNFQGLSPHPIIGGRQFHVGGTGEWGDWAGILATTDEVRRQARLYLDSEPPVDQVIPYNGSIQFPPGDRAATELRPDANRSPPLHPRGRDSHHPLAPGTRHGQSCQPRLGPSSGLNRPTATCRPTHRPRPLQSRRRVLCPPS